MNKEIDKTKEKNNIRAKIQNIRHMQNPSFREILNGGLLDKLEILINEEIDFKTISFLDDETYKIKYGELDSLIDDIVETNNVEVIKKVLEHQPYKENDGYPEMVLYAISIGFVRACKENKIDLINYYKELNDLYNNECKGLYVTTLTKENKSIVMYRYLFQSALNEVIDSKVDCVDALDFIMQNKDKYLSDDCQLGIAQYTSILYGETLKVNTLNYIEKYLNISSYENIFIKFFNSLHYNYDRLKSAAPGLRYLILEKNITLTEEIKELIDGIPLVEKMFLNRELNENLLVNQKNEQIFKL